MNVVAGTACSRSNARSLSSFNDRSSSLSHSGDKLSVKPFIITDCASQSSRLSRLGIVVDSGEVDIWELSCTMVAPDDEVSDVSNISLESISNLVGSSVLVQAGESGEVFLRNGGGKVRANQSICVSWISYNKHFAIFVSIFIKGLSLSLENKTVLSK